MTHEHVAPDAKDFYDVPAGAAEKPCRLKDCERTFFWIDSPKNPGKRIPVDCDVEGGVRPTATEPGRGISHFKTCKKPSVFSRKSERERQPLSEAEIEERAQHEMHVAHKSPACIFCGCTALKACVLSIAEAGLEGDEIPLGEDEQPVRFVGCSWISLDPPVCSAPPCKQRFDELPLRKRVHRLQHRATA